MPKVRRQRLKACFPSNNYIKNFHLVEIFPPNRKKYNKTYGEFDYERKQTVEIK